MAGENVRVIDSVPNSSVDVMGIDNHRVTDVPIVTAGAVINTQKGEVIAIMNRYALLGKGKTIHSCGQLEHHKLTVDDKSRKVDGNQRITTMDGHVIPLNIRNGLPHMTMRPCTDEEWERLPKVMLTADVDWDPKVLDDEMEDDDEWFNAMDDLPDLTPDPLFDEFGEYRHTVEVSETTVESMMADSILENSVITDIPCMVEICEREVNPRPVDCESFQRNFCWLPTNVIKQTFENTNQWHKMPMCTHLLKSYKAPHPACNVHRRNEPVASDEVFSDTPAIDGGETSAQIFVGTESLVTDVYGMKSV